MTEYEKLKKGVMKSLEMLIEKYNRHSHELANAQENWDTDVWDWLLAQKCVTLTAIQYLCEVLDVCVDFVPCEEDNIYYTIAKIAE